MSKASSIVTSVMQQSSTVSDLLSVITHVVGWPCAGIINQTSSPTVRHRALSNNISGDLPSSLSFWIHISLY